MDSGTKVSNLQLYINDTFHHRHFAMHVLCRAEYVGQGRNPTNNKFAGVARKEKPDGTCEFRAQVKDMKFAPHILTSPFTTDDVVAASMADL